jgi:hypothetical protein
MSVLSCGGFEKILRSYVYEARTAMTKNVCSTTAHYKTIQVLVMEPFAIYLWPSEEHNKSSLYGVHKCAMIRQFGRFAKSVRQRNKVAIWRQSSRSVGKFIIQILESGER